MIDECPTETPVAKNRTAEFANFVRRLQPTRGLPVKFTQILERDVFLLSQKLDTHSHRRVDGVVQGFMLLAGVQRFAVIAAVDASLRRLGRAIHKNNPLRASPPDHIWISTRANLLTLVSQRFSEVSPFDTIIRWAGELMEETECGFAILDAAFPQELEIGFDDQPSVFLAALRKFLDADFKLPKAFPQDALQPIGTALSESSLGLLVN